VRKSTFGAFVFFAAFAAFSVKVKSDVARSQALKSFSVSVSEGAKPADFHLPSSDGAIYRLEDEVAGSRVVLINFWATWCPPCRIELPQLERLYSRYRDSGLQILAVDVGEDEETVRDFLRRRPVSFPVLLDSERHVAAKYHVEAFPTTILLDAEGNVIEVIEGLDPYLAYRVESLLEPESEAVDEY